VPLALSAQQAPASELNSAARAFLQGLRSLGYVEGQKLVMEWRSAEGRFQRFPEIVRELVSIRQTSLWRLPPG
jgi:putative ABC transport system substrate-binding protein